jgi:hypothetical protein
VEGDHEKNVPTEWRGTMRSLLETACLKRSFTHWTDAPAPKQEPLNLRWNTVCKYVVFAFGGVPDWCFDGPGKGTPPPWSRMSPSQRATVEAFFAAGPPVELAEDEFVSPDGSRQTMRVDGKRLAIKVKSGWFSYSRGELEKFAALHPDPLGWPRALAYFEKHVAKPEPARVTDVRYDAVRQVEAWKVKQAFRNGASVDWVRLRALDEEVFAAVERLVGK